MSSSEMTNLTRSDILTVYPNEAKAYPSVYSMNSGDLHSEEDVKWITNKVTDKAFIASRDQANFYIDTNAIPMYESNGIKMYMYPASVSLDGYLIKVGDPANASFDTYSTDPIFVDTKYQHKFVEDVYMDSLNNYKNLNSIVYPEFQLNDENPDYERSWNSLTGSDDIIGKVSIVYSGDIVNDLIYSSDEQRIYYSGDYKIEVISGEVSENEKITTPKANVTLNNGVLSSTTIYYPVTLSKKLIVGNDKLMPDNVPVIKFTDIFGFEFIRSVASGETKEYPTAHSSVNTDADNYGSFDMISDTKAKAKVLTSENNLDEFSNAYLTSNPFILQNIENLYDSNGVRKTSLSDESTEAVLSEITSDSNISDVYTESALGTSTPTTKLFLKLSNNGLSDLMKPAGQGVLEADIKTNLDFFVIPEIDTETLLSFTSTSNAVKLVPVVFMSSDGSLIPNGLYRTEYDSEGTGTSVIKGDYPVEGYVHYIKRMYLTKYRPGSSTTEESINAVSISNLVAWSKDTEAEQGRNFYTYFTPIEKRISFYLQLAYGTMLGRCRGNVQNPKKDLRYSSYEIQSYLQTPTGHQVFDEFYTTVPATASVFRNYTPEHNQARETEDYNQKFVLNKTTDSNKVITAVTGSTYPPVINVWRIPDNDNIKQYYKAVTFNSEISPYPTTIDFEDPINYLRNCSGHSDTGLVFHFWKAYEVNPPQDKTVALSQISSFYIDPIDGSQEDKSAVNGVNLTDCLLPTDAIPFSSSVRVDRPPYNTPYRVSPPVASDGFMSGISWSYDYETWLCEIPFAVKRNLGAHSYLIGPHIHQLPDNSTEFIYGGCTFMFNTWKEVLDIGDSCLCYGTVQFGCDVTNTDYSVETGLQYYDNTDVSNETRRNTFINVNNIHADGNTSLYEYVIHIIENCDYIKAISGGIIETSGQCGDNVFYDIYFNGKIILHGTGDTWDWNPYAQTKSFSPFYNNQKITQVIVESGVTRIGDFAFYWCDNIETVTLPVTGFTEIGKFAFAPTQDAKTIPTESKGVRDIILPNSLTLIDAFAFEGTRLRTITIPSSAVVACRYGSGTELDPYTYEYSKSYAFARCTELKTAIFKPATVGGKIFNWCENLENVEFPASGTSPALTTITDHWAEYCPKLGTVTYDGTKAEWSLVTKAAWDGHSNYIKQREITDGYVLPCTSIETVQCTDGDFKWQNGAWVET